MTPFWVALAGMLITFGLVSFLGALVPAAPRLPDALARIAESGSADGSVGRAELGVVQTRSQRLGALTYRLLPLPLSERLLGRLRLNGRSVLDFYGDKAALALVGGSLPAVLAFGYSLASDAAIYVPLLVGALGAVVGFFTPDLLLLRETRRARSSAVEALLVFIDLVTLERLANASATQALNNAAYVSDAPLFLQLRGALERARLEQRPPYGELRRLAEEMSVPELVDVADVMQLDESGAALSGTLRARVRELRDAHLTQEQLAASAAAEGMTVYMTLPALVFGAIFMGAALLRIIGS